MELKLKVKIKLYSVWFMVNFIICLIPIVVALITGNERSQVFSSFLSFLFTLLISSLYLFENFIYMKDEKILPDPLRWGTITWVFILMTIFMLYPEMKSIAIKPFMEKNIEIIALLFFLCTLYLSFLLNNPSLQNTVAKRLKELKDQELRKVKEDAQKMEEELRGGNNI